VAGEIADFDARSFFSEEMIYSTVRFSQFALAANILALKDANLDIKNADSQRIGVSIGTTTGGIGFILDQQAIYIKEKSFKNVHPYAFSKTVLNACSSLVAIMNQAKGPCSTFCSACAASSDAIGFGFNSIIKGDTDIMFVGGAESSIHPLMLEACFLGGMISKKAQKLDINIPQPFDKNRDGTVIGEGAAILVLEEIEHAKKRNANIYAELAGYGATCDAHHMVRILSTGEESQRAIEVAIQEAGIKPEDIGYINAHGTGTISNDKIETLVIKKVFGEQATKIPISSTKSMTGHLFGAGGAIEAAICALVLKNNILPPTINYQEFDPECDLDYIPNKARDKEVEYTLSNSLGFGGENAALIFKKYEK
jgi:3-oxoacyl-[acyl-carrier-protein] synthase II